MIKEQKTNAELEAMIHAESNEPHIGISVALDPIGWDIVTTAYGDNAIELTMKAKQIAERLRA